MLCTVKKRTFSYIITNVTVLDVSTGSAGLMGWLIGACVALVGLKKKKRKRKERSTL